MTITPTKGKDIHHYGVQIRDSTKKRRQGQFIIDPKLDQRLWCDEPGAIFRDPIPHGTPQIKEMVLKWQPYKSRHDAIVVK